MELTKLTVSHFRNISQASLNLHTNFNFIIGANGSGKTSLLEAVYTLGRGRSFKATNTDKLIQHGTEGFIVTGQIRTETQKSQLGIQRSQKQTHIRHSGRSIKTASELSEILPLQVIEPRLHAFFEQGPEVRRKFLEWGVFHVEPRYEKEWRTYRRVLLQRNAALKAQWSVEAIEQWDSLLIDSATQIDLYRKDYLEKMSIFVDQYAQNHQLSFLPGLSIEYYSGWNKGLSFAEALRASQSSDRERGFTQRGPHRADIRIKLGRELGKDILSRGQQKLFIYLLYIAQSVSLKKFSRKSPLILIDDFAAELDQPAIQTLNDIFSSTGCQMFVTATSLDLLGNSSKELPNAVFHVEHGKIEQVI